MKKILMILVAMGLSLTMAQTALATAMYNANTGHWYDIVSGGAYGDWFVAEQKANALGGHLVTINDATEENWLRGTFGTSRYWIGLTRSGPTETDFKWISGEAVSYTNWSAGEPNDSYGGEKYTVMNWWEGNKWNDLAPGNSSCAITVHETYIDDFGFTEGIAEWSGPAPVPEPGTMVLLGLGMFGLAIFGKRRMGCKKS